MCRSGWKLASIALLVAFGLLHPARAYRALSQEPTDPKEKPAASPPETVSPLQAIIGGLMPGPADRGNWGPEQATGEPNTPTAGDIPTAWASLTEDQQPEWLELKYAEPIEAVEVHVYESYNPGSLVKVSVFDPDGKEVEVFKGKDPTPRERKMGVSTIALGVDFPVDRVKLYLDSPSVPGWNEIDAVGLVDRKDKKHWATSATASSTFASRMVFPDPAEFPFSPPPIENFWGPEEATGEPNTHPPGDIPTAWASQTPDGQAEWLLLEYAKPVKAVAVHVYETYNPGALTRVCVFDDKGNEVEVFKGKDPTGSDKEMGVSEIPVRIDFPIDRVKLYLDSPAVAGWNEIDAVGLVDSEGKKHWATSATASSTFKTLLQPFPGLLLR